MTSCIRFDSLVLTGVKPARAAHVRFSLSPPDTPGQARSGIIPELAAAVHCKLLSAHGSVKAG